MSETEQTGAKLGHSDVELLQQVVMDAGRRAMKARKKAKRRGDDEGRKAHPHMAAHLAPVHMRLGRMHGDPRKQLGDMVGRVMSELTGSSATATVIGPGDPKAGEEQRAAE